MVTKDRVVLGRDSSGKVSKGWRIERYSIGRIAVHHLRSGRVNVGCDDGFGNVIDAPLMLDAPFFNVGETHNGYMP